MFRRLTPRSTAMSNDVPKLVEVLKPGPRRILSYVHAACIPEIKDG
jgi:hypothetical protein